MDLINFLSSSHLTPASPQMSCNILMVAEKPSLAESIAKILSNGRLKSRKGLNNACSVHEFRGPFNGMRDCFFKFTSGNSMISLIRFSDPKDFL